PSAWGSHARNSRDRAPGPLTARGDRLRCSRIPGSNYGTGLTHQAKTDLYAGDAGAVYSTVSSRCRSAKPVGNYGENLEEKLTQLHDRIHKGSYRARPARRTYIPKADGTQRPLAVLCLEDKIVQQAVAAVLEAIYEEDFVGFSYGFRPGRGQHDALDALHVGILRKRGNWVLDSDIRGFYDAMSHTWIIRLLEHRIADKRILRLIAKWLKVGIIEDGRVTRSQVGAPQGAVISPILANVYLHYVNDLWVQRWRHTKANGDVIVVRYADDQIVGFEHEHEAKAFLHDLHERMRAFELALHPDKTRLIRFGRHAAKQREMRGEGKPETFDFLGFTHFCTRSHKWGSFVIGRKTIKKRMR